MDVLRTGLVEKTILSLCFIQKYHDRQVMLLLHELRTCRDMQC